MKLVNESPDFSLYLAAGPIIVPPGEPVIPPPAEPVYFFIQFTRSLTLEERKRLQDQHGFLFNRYIPNFAFLERVDFETWNELRQDSLFRAIERYKAEYKISPALGTREAFVREEGNPTGLLLRAVLFPEATEDDIEKIITVIMSLRGSNANELSRQDENETVRVVDNRHIGGDLQLIFLSPLTAGLPKIAEIEVVQWIEEVSQPEIDSSLTSEAVLVPAADGCPFKQNLVAGTIQSGMPGVTPFWQTGLNGSNQIVGILDEYGADLAHCMFRDNKGTPIGMAHRKVVGFRNPSGYISIHATLVSGIVAGDQVSLTGMAENRGIAWAAKLALDDLHNIKNREETVLDVFSRQLQDGATIHSNSWHEEPTDYNETSKNTDTFVYHHEENLVCGSAGNSSVAERLGPPGTAKNSLCVCAGGQHPYHLEHRDGQTGPTVDNRSKPDLCAPGCGITSAKSRSGCLCKTPNCATSYATPVIAGAAALVRQYYLEGFYPDGVRNLANAHRPSAALIKATLLNSTVRMMDEEDYPNFTTGWGLIKLNDALFLAGAPRKLFIADVRNANGLATWQSHTYNIPVNSSSEPLKITLVWTDPPAQTSTGKALVNDLNLIVTSPGGSEIYRGNTNFVDGFSNPSANPAADDLNNVERVIIANPAAGAWRVTVEGKAVNIGKQGYALVLTGSLDT